MPIDIIINLIVGFILLFVERRKAVLLFISAIILIPSENSIPILGGNFFSMRIIIFFAILRIILKHKHNISRLNNIDYIFFLFVGMNVIAFTLRRGDLNAFINRLGFAYNTIGTYLFIRINVLDYEDIKIIFSFLPIIMIVLSVGMLIEFTTKINPFLFVGASNKYEMYRDGILRCRGSFFHPILTGTFGAVSIPLVASLLTRKETRIKAILGIISGLSIVILSHSSGPIFTLIVTLIGFLLWRYRKYMNALRWAFILCLLALELMMKSHIWSLIGKFSEFSGGTGWHRYELINSFFRHFDDWWFIGTDSTADWLGYVISSEFNSVDATNQYIRFAIDGGLVTMCLFIYLLGKCSSKIGRIRKEMEPTSSEGAFFYWTLGMSLVANIVSFFSVSYFDKSIIYFCFIIAVVALSTVDKYFLELKQTRTEFVPIN